MLFAASLSAEAQTQTFETAFARPLNEVLTDIQNRFGIRLKYDIDTVGKVLPYADFRIRPYSVEESLTNVLSPFDYKFVKQTGNIYKLKAYEYPRRTDADGEKMLAYLNTLYADKEAFELRADSLRKEVRQRLGIDLLLAQCVESKPILSKVRKYDGYTVQNFALETLPGLYVGIAKINNSVLEPWHVWGLFVWIMISSVGESQFCRLAVRHTAVVQLIPFRR